MGARDKHEECQSERLAESISMLACAVREHTEHCKNEFEWYKSHTGFATKNDLLNLENRMAIKVSEIKTAVAEIKANNAEAYAELGTRIADLQKQIDDLIAGNGDPSVTDAQFEADLQEARSQAAALAGIVPGTPTPA